ncbi:hypothetical protein [Microbulbifer taiwanensis]|uniref:hypothetical protein n=1 Tax=Microbulbifer taiwanensis TaxID=986746 RepID=UPI0036066691
MLDPFFRTAIDEGREGLFLLREVAPDAFEQTEYFRVYYREAHLSDEACYLVQGRTAPSPACRSGARRTSAEGVFPARKSHCCARCFHW